MKLVVCLGNPLAGDDAFGCLVADELRRTGWENVAVCGPDLAPLISRLEEIDTLVIVDAVDWGAEPGSILVRRIEEIEDESGPVSHSISPLRMIRTVMRAAGRPKKVYVVGVNPERAGPGEEISEAVRRSVGPAVFEILRILRE
jgi:hydrogenase maturation protease